MKFESSDYQVRRYVRKRVTSLYLTNVHLRTATTTGKHLTHLRPHRPHTHPTTSLPPKKNTHTFPPLSAAPPHDFHIHKYTPTTNITLQRSPQPTSHSNAHHNQHHTATLTTINSTLHAHQKQHTLTYTTASSTNNTHTAPQQQIQKIKITAKRATVVGTRQNYENSQRQFEYGLHVQTIMEKGKIMMSSAWFNEQPCDAAVSVFLVNNYVFDSNNAFVFVQRHLV